MTAAARRTWLAIGALLAGLAVVMGAFAAHALEAQLDSEAMAIYRTGAQYHLYHALGLLLIAAVAGRGVHGGTSWIAAAVMLIGVVIFSGSLYLLALTGASWLGAITPLGGTALVIAWLVLAVGAFRGG